MTDRDNIVKVLDDFKYNLSGCAGNNKCFVVDDHIELANHLVANGVIVQKHGRWILKKTCGVNTEKWHCSVCDKPPNSLCIEDYCPNCGADMR